jgi:chromosome segregation ATPase
MSVIRPERPADKMSAITAGVEAEIKEFVRHASPRQSAVKNSETFGNSISDTIERVASTSVAEINRLIAELTLLRDRLQDEGNRVQSEIARVQNEIAGFTQSSQSAAQSIKAIDQSLEQFKRAAGPSQTH